MMGYGSYRGKPRGGGMTNTHGEYYDALPRRNEGPPISEDCAEANERLRHGLLPLRAWLRENKAINGGEYVTEAALRTLQQQQSQAETIYEILRWLLDTYTFERSTTTKIRDLLPGRK